MLFFWYRKRAATAHCANPSPDLGSVALRVVL